MGSDSQGQIDDESAMIIVTIYSIINNKNNYGNVPK